jgi:hypothetical protein
MPLSIKFVVLWSHALCGLVDWCDILDVNFAYMIKAEILIHVMHSSAPIHKSFRLALL